VVASLWTLASVKPNYLSRAYIQLIPPKSQPAEPGTPSVDQRNPWLSLGLNTLANAAMVTVQDLAVIQELERGGFSDTFTVTLGSSSPLVTFEITGSTQAQALATTDQLVRRFEESVIDLQGVYRVAPADLITPRRLDLGTNLEESDARVKRALVGVAGAGMLLTVALTVGLDALIRRRGRRRAGLAEADILPAAMPFVARPQTALPSLFLPPGEPTVSLRRDLPSPSTNYHSRPESSPTVRTFPGQAGNAASSASNGGGPPRVALEYHALPSVESRIPDAAGLSDGHDGAPGEGLDPLDATIVLPLSHSKPQRRDKVDGEDKPPR
jgi:hypothetical protein